MPPKILHYIYVGQELWWCNSHQRRATWVEHKFHPKTQRNEWKNCCDPNLRGITLPCSVVNLTGEVELVSEK